MGDYNQVSGRNLERISAISDGLFAVAMTLLVLELHVPAAATIHSEGDLQRALLALAPRALTYGLSLLTLGIFWVGQQTQLAYVARSDRDFTWLSLAFLGVVTLMPFSTQLLAEHTNLRTALVAYWLNIVALGGMLLLIWRHIEKRGLAREDTPVGVRRQVLHRIVRAQLLYAFGAALCVFSTYASMAFIVAVQLNYAFGSPVLKKLTT